MIREAVVEEDAALLVELNGYVHAVHLQAEPEIYRETDPAAVEAWFRERLARPGWHGLVAEVDGQAVGLAVTELVERPEHAYAHVQRYMMVNQIAVAPAWRRKGIGRALMEEVHARAKALGVERVELEVRGWNAGAVRLYEGLGYGVGSLRMVRGPKGDRGMNEDSGDLVETARTYATACHAAVNQSYDGRPYSFHLGMVADMAHTFQELLPSEQREVAVAGAWVHDVIEDARQTYGDVLKAVGVEVAEVAYALTNEKGRTRAERANDRYYDGIKANAVAHFVKICDRLANVAHSASQGGRMLEVYRKEYPEFREKLWKPGLGPMFERLEQLLGFVLRDEVEGDRAGIGEVNRAAFGGADEAELVDALRNAGALVLSLVAAAGGEIVGHIAFSPVTIEGGGGSTSAIGLAPMAVAPGWQRRGVGARLITDGLDRLRAAGHRAVIVLGHPEYYPRFGFVRASRFGLRWEHPARDEAFMAIELVPGGLEGVEGVVRYRGEFDRFG